MYKPRGCHSFLAKSIWLAALRTQKAALSRDQLKPCELVESLSITGNLVDLSISLCIFFLFVIHLDIVYMSATCMEPLSCLGLSMTVLVCVCVRSAVVMAVLCFNIPRIIYVKVFFYSKACKFSEPFLGTQHANTCYFAAMYCQYNHTIMYSELSIYSVIYCLSNNISINYFISDLFFFHTYILCRK